MKTLWGTRCPKLSPQSHSSNVPPTPAKEPTGQSYKGRGDSAGSWNRTKISNTTISCPHWPAPRALI